MSTIPKSVSVTIDKKDGWWHATSEDLKGLLVAHPTLTVFSKELPEVIGLLLKAKYGVEVDVTEMSSPDSNNFHHLTFMAEKRAA